MVYEDEEDEQELGPHVLAVFIHQVLLDAEPLAVEEPAERGEDWEDELRQQHLFFHKTYVGAAVAVHAANPRLMPAKKVAKVANDAVDYMDMLRYTYPEWDEDLREEAETALQADLARAGVVTKKAGLSAPKVLQVYEAL